MLVKQLLPGQTKQKILIDKELKLQYVWAEAACTGICVGLSDDKELTVQHSCTALNLQSTKILFSVIVSHQA